MREREHAQEITTVRSLLDKNADEIAQLKLQPTEARGISVPGLELSMFIGLGCPKHDAP
ncbi:hypothetical protein VD0002_g8829 [Verticillium dahliae]|uniref:Uncharacterized protein n=1 Tax=Verticillium dahliae TaxID=27337 RepID=A0A2J8BZE1_VERDA|nr:hypothetical protein BJF96_g6561 [Verticillium dahliae]PNH47139.1 hypothetical protein VD0004_g1127 [Verticillium dahliae]PNH55516.1 hypothetical protein VD0003_g2092 [Verticillium dahliae]PNH58709.1 hypothetical protein VD0002_g8829 [Verticillium dahliae]PNH76745.1 hypothetical protein VD0001_g776 [Verticillium dahliae]